MSPEPDLSLPEDLLFQAFSALDDKEMPSQASLRRCISTAYYAVFHLLVAEVVRTTLPATPPGLNLRIARSLAHGDMREVCSTVTKPALPKVLLSLRPQGFSAELRAVAEAFVALQDDRHAADYDLGVTFTHAEALGRVRRASSVFEKWKLIRDSDEATVFLAALLFAKRWSR